MNPAKARHVQNRLLKRSTSHVVPYTRCGSTGTASVSFQVGGPWSSRRLELGGVHKGRPIFSESTCARSNGCLAPTITTRRFTFPCPSDDRNYETWDAI